MNQILAGIHNTCQVTSKVRGFENNRVARLDEYKCGCLCGVTGTHLGILQIITGCYGSLQVLQVLTGLTAFDGLCCLAGLGCDSGATVLNHWRGTIGSTGHYRVYRPQHCWNTNAIWVCGPVPASHYGAYRYVQKLTGLTRKVAPTDFCNLVQPCKLGRVTTGCYKKLQRTAAHYRIA